MAALEVDAMNPNASADPKMVTDINDQIGLVSSGALPAFGPLHARALSAFGLPAFGPHHVLTSR
jgi:hypothetical protein